MVQRWLQAISLFSIVNILMVVVSITFKPLPSSDLSPNATSTSKLRHRETPAEQPLSVDRSTNSAESRPAAKLQSEAPRVDDIVPAPPAVDDLLMNELKRQAAASMPASFRSDAKPIVEAPNPASTEKALSSETKAGSINAAQARSSALRELSAVVDSLTQIEAQLKQLGQEEQAKQIRHQLDSLQLQIRELLEP